MILAVARHMRQEGRRLARTAADAPVARLAALAAVVGAVAIYGLAMVATAGAAGPLHHLPYPAILVAAYLWGLRGALLLALLPVGISGLYPLISHVDETHTAWLRGVGFLTVAGVSGLLVERLRGMADEWRSLALSVDQREHDGLTALALAAEARDELTGEHAQRVEHVSERLALAAGMTSEEASAIGRASLLHDIGKLKVPDSVLLKPGPLTRDEMDLVRRHTLWGEAILAHGDAFRVARMVARWHHENFDGTGYPDNLRGDAIPMAARVVRIADAFDAMTNDRPYRAARTVEQALDELRTGAGRLFDPELMTQFLELIESAHADVVRTGITQALALTVRRRDRLALGRWS